ncbi:putative licABCH operon regulator [Oceanobacillus oncorhynchi subsp. incaldanensis]|uniref:Putative licABCH operon regulator n=1 Tax=Oceanobacillus oncorhynchi TaxID=545501 RepID=A0A0A1M9C1_9BACI|nr:BglG family transcription antiterminator [Oceanobacillus oncorhynchi]GIO18553.1 putative licABCH operon regulator [Oceanobacillus oncorhynchi subsp. incaldanensis]CEI81935.1 putative licABCH operon regulator [Oceanobacillus oncorhynchi]
MVNETIRTEDQSGMHMNVRWKQILHLLLTSGKSLTSHELAIELQVSSKTIRNDMKKLRPLLADYHIEIASVRGKGYTLINTDQKKITAFYQQHMEQSIPVEPEDRVHFLMEKLLLQTDYIKLNEIMEKIYVSRSTLQSDLRQVRKILADYQLTLDQKPNYGIKVKGDEMQIRFCIAEWLFQQSTSFLHHEMDLSILNEKDLKMIRDTVLSHLRQNKIIISDINLHNLITHVAISVRRLRENNTIQKNIYDANLQDTTEYEVAQKILLEIEENLSIIFPSNEVAYLTIHLMGTKLLSHEESTTELHQVIDADTLKLAEQMIERIDNQYGFHLKEDKELKLALALHLKPAINRYQYQMNMRNPMLDEIKMNYPLSFEAALAGSEVLIEEKSITIKEDEIAYLALHIEVAQERRKQLVASKKRCLIVCASGMGSAHLLKYKLKSMLSEDLVIVGTTEMHNLKYHSLDYIDLIITTIAIPWDTGKPVIQVSTILGKSDLSNIQQLLRKGKDITDNYLYESFTYLQQSFSQPDSILHFMCNEIYKAGFANENYLDSVLSREEYAPTSFGNLVAIPHPLEPKSTHTFWSVMTLAKPVDWGKKPVQLVFLLSVKKENPKEMKKMFEALGDLLEDRDLIQRLIACTTFKQFNHTLQQWKDL